MVLKQLFIITKKKEINELWQKMSDVEIRLGFSNIADVALKRIIRKYCGKKTEDITEEEKQNNKAFF